MAFHRIFLKHQYKVYRVTSVLSFNGPFFLAFLSFSKISQIQVRINKIVNSVVYHFCPLRLVSRIHPFIFIQGLGLYLSEPQLVEFSLTLYSTMCGKNFKIYGVHIHRKCIESRVGTFTHACSVCHSQLQTEYFEI